MGRIKVEPPPMTQNRKQHSAACKAQVVLEALRGQRRPPG